MGELKSPVLIWTKGLLFVVAGLMGAVGILLEQPEFRTVALLAVVVWCFSRAYYFAFHVLEHYVDSEYRYSGLWSLVSYALNRSRRTVERDAGN